MSSEVLHAPRSPNLWAEQVLGGWSSPKQWIPILTSHYLI